ncbi:MAG: 4-hydroxy-tetrahydrodipicolinate synthase [Proteobacteria bacterium]|nr:4-hydroxy-tetrahydrodipicolinate synthase [Pseudomonadota bacterium]
MGFSANGIYTAIVTPFDRNGEIDEATFRSLVDFQVSAGVAGLLVAGGSGEYVSLTVAERKRLVDIALDQAAGRISIIVGSLSPSTGEVQEMARHAAASGAAAVLVLPPYYIKPSAAGVFEHFARVADASPTPIVAYNNTGRTGLTLDVSMLQKLTEIPSIVALKECERDLAIISAKIAAVGDRIATMSGDDDLGFPTFLLGSPGGIFMSSNLIPAFHCKLLDAAKAGDLDTGRRAHYALLPLIEALYTLNHPGPLREAMAFIGRPVGPARSPLQGGTPQALEKAKAALNTIKLMTF